MKQIFTFLLTLFCVQLHAQKVSSDTLEINDTSIHFIQIGSQIFGVKRTVSLEPVSPVVFSRLSGTGFLSFPTPSTPSAAITLLNNSDFKQ